LNARLTLIDLYDATFAEGEFWSKKSTIPSGMGRYCSIFGDFKLHKEGSFTFSKSGTKERT